MNKQFKELLTKAVWIAIILFIIRCLFSFNTLVEDFSVYVIFGFAGEAIGLTTIIIALYERHLWRFNPFEDTPKLHSNYTGILLSGYDNIERIAKLEIKQTLLSTHIILFSGESRSKSITSSIDTVLGEKQLTYCYLNTPVAAVRDRSEIHYGTAMLYIENSNKISGQYFTDRKTTGDMCFYQQEESSYRQNEKTSAQI